MFCYNEFAFTVQVKHKINSTQILGLILICLYFPTGHFHTRVLCKECSRYLPFLILGSVFSDCVVFYGDVIKVAKRQSPNVTFYIQHKKSQQAGQRKPPPGHTCTCTCHTDGQTTWKHNASSPVYWKSRSMKSIFQQWLGNQAVCVWLITKFNVS